MSATAQGSTGAAPLVALAALAVLGVVAGGVLTYHEATEPRGRKGPQEPRSARPSLPPGTTQARAPTTAIRALSATRAAPPDRLLAIAPDPRLQGALVGMGFRAPEVKAALAKMPTRLATEPFGEQVRGALALLAK
jgi:hypothetical protein